ncbi:hypothetical protein GQ464_007885 [Rhodocaloribacter litoris]|uniref:hypothetical protein n=1 Tax=Rhodocaloribacter litoris TaxID=2558931 RepID=UPI00142212F3|nr:hypothetical protein [Rhodocaloribacter litoris]QXD16847.1 hypothetical protein GQ464_007885 [Rhodocaloribacter litoris]
MPVFSLIVIVETLPLSKSVDELVEQLLRDQDFLLAKEIKHKIEELNQLLVRAQSQKLKVEIEVSQVDLPSGGTVSYVDVKLFKPL